MRIDLLGPAANPASSAAVDATAVGGVSATRASAKNAEDTATLSTPSVSVPSLAEQALQAAEARYAKVDALNRAVSSGAYTLDPSLIAQAIISAGV